MAHRAAVYDVFVRRTGRGKSDQRVPLGALNDQGASLANALLGYLPELQAQNAADDKDIRCISAVPDGDDLQVMVEHGLRGVRAQITAPGGKLLLTQKVGDTSRVRCGALFRLPPAANLGWLCIHNNGGRAIKGLLTDKLISSFRADFPKLALEITPCVPQHVLMEAIEKDHIDKIKLIRYVRPSDAANPNGASKWIPGDTAGKIELDIHGARMNGTLLRRFFGGDEEGARNQIIRFDGARYEEAKVVVNVGGGKQRTFNIEKLESGHPVTIDLDGLETADGEVSEDSLFRSLAAVLTEVTG